MIAFKLTTEAYVCILGETCNHLIYQRSKKTEKKNKKPANEGHVYKF